MEAVTGFRAEFRSEIASLRAELTRRIEVLELAVRQNSADIRQNTEDIRVMKEDIRVMKEDTRVMKEDIRVMKEDIRVAKEDIRVAKEDIRQNSAEIRALRELLERKADRESLIRIEARVQTLEQRLGIHSA